MNNEKEREKVMAVAQPAHKWRKIKSDELRRQLEELRSIKLQLQSTVRSTLDKYI